MAAKTILSLVIPTYNKSHEVLALLKSVTSSRFNNWDSIEAIVVDDGSKNEVEKFLGAQSVQFPFTVIVSRLSPNKGPAHARNWGVSKAKGKFVLFLDADVRLRQHSLARAYAFFDKGKGKALTGIWAADQKTKDFFPQFKALRDAGYWFIEREHNSRYYLFSTRIAGIEKKLFQKLGGFNTHYPKPTVEDIEFTYRVEQKTPIHFKPDIIVDHEFEDFPTVAKKYFARSRDWIKLYIKRLRFDPVATSKAEAKKSVLVGLFCMALTGYVFLGVLPLLFLATALGGLYLWLELPFLQFLMKKKGLLFTLQSIPVAMFLYLVIDAGSTWGLIEYYLLHKKNPA